MKHPPDKLLYTFNYIAERTISEGKDLSQATDTFTASLRNYMEFMRDTDGELEKKKTLPESIKIYDFEFLFTHMFLDEEFSFNQISTEKLINRWLTKLKPTAEKKI